MTKRELSAAGIANPALAASYNHCRRINAAHGKTYYLATLLLPPAKRPYVHALYGFARYADDIVDSLDDKPVSQRSAALAELADRFFIDLERGHSDHPVCAATVDTALRWGIDTEYFEAFIDSMQMDLHIDHYDTYADLETYVYGSAAVIGLQMVPILEPSDRRAFDYAKDLGIAFQLANFIRDVGEDLERNRIYLPLDELAEFGVSADDVRARVVTPQLRAALAAQIDRVRRLEEQSRPGIAMLAPDSQPCIETARVLYCGIVDEVENIDYEVFTKRAKVPLNRRLAVAVPAWRKARRARR
ncbi:MAG: phytoene/squalene synthase family protein [Actinobacteria bacterium]|nr:phytoene/squalene synthase family protein [Actinomycetota bacterium]